MLHMNFKNIGAVYKKINICKWTQNFCIITTVVPSNFDIVKPLFRSEQQTNNTGDMRRRPNSYLFDCLDKSMNFRLTSAQTSGGGSFLHSSLYQILFLFSGLENFRTQRTGLSTAAWFIFLSKKMQIKQDRISKRSKFSYYIETIWFKWIIPYEGSDP